MESEAEFIMKLSIYGGMILAGTLIIIGLSMLAFGLKNASKKKEIIDKVYEQKQRKNGKMQM